MIDNIVLKFDREENQNLVFKTESGQEVTVAKDLLDKIPEKGETFYFNLNNQPLGGDDNAKQILNELLDGEDG